VASATFKGYTYGMSKESKTYTEAQATDEAMLLLTRKLRRQERAAFDKIWAQLPDGAKDAIFRAEARADQVRDAGGLTWEMDEE
jgi:hypothetical protein